MAKMDSTAHPIFRYMTKYSSGKIRCQAAMAGMEAAGRSCSWFLGFLPNGLNSNFKVVVTEVIFQALSGLCFERWAACSTFYPFGCPGRENHAGQLPTLPTVSAG